jgi:sedoheptulokinase
MRVIALDIGTTSICALAVDEDSGAVLEILSAANSFLPSPHPWERIQDPERILGIAEGMCSALTKKHAPIRGIGVTGQMHGILYVNPSGRAVSPLYTWQDMCGALPCRDGKTYTDYLNEQPPGNAAGGYGLVTHFYRGCTHTIPAGASGICTIGDYITLSFCEAHKPLIHTTNAAGLGFFDLPCRSFDVHNMEKAGIDPSFLPRISGEYDIAGETQSGVPVCVAIGDNQAGFLGSVRDVDSSILINMGTGSQISLISRGDETAGGLELRPFFEHRYLWAGASLSGGRAYALLEDFFQGVLRMAGTSSDQPLYPVMDNCALTDHPSACSLEVNTMFAGSREDSSARGWIKNISEDNFTPASMIKGFLHGMARELYEMFLPVPERHTYKHLIGSGNGLRKNLPLRRIISEKFNMPVNMPRYEEEAAYGAALFALICTGRFSGITEAQGIIHYQEAATSQESLIL